MDALEGSLASATCGRCGGASSPQARFCQHCGTPLDPDDPAVWYDQTEGVPPPTERSAPPGAGSIVTAIVVELSPASPGEAEDEPSRSAADDASVVVPLELIDAAREAFRLAGAQVEDLDEEGATVAAVFGPEPEGGDGPVVALRVAAELRRALEEGGPIRMRAGVGTAEVFGEGAEAEHLWRERAVDLATGLRWRAEPGEIVVAESVYRRVDGAAELEPIDPNAPFDADAPTGPLRLLEVDPDPATLTLGQPMLAGRDEERERLRAAFARATAERVGVLARVFGDPGIGTTRLVEDCLAEFASDEQVRVVSVRWGPAVEPGSPSALAGLIEAVAGVDAAADAERVRGQIGRLVEGRPDAERVVERLLPALGLAGTADPDATEWALRRLLEAAAHDGPLAIRLDDADRTGQWFLELVRAATLRAHVPIIVVASGEAGGWPATWLREPVEQVRVPPLDHDSTAALLRDLLRNPDPPAQARDRLIAATGGNPLYLEQLMAELADRGLLRWEHRRWVPAGDLEEIPRDLRELLSHRLQELELPERALLGLLAVAGAEIPSGLVEELVPSDEPSAREHLGALVNRRFLRLETSEAGETYRFPHELAREVARAAVPPEVEAEVHERCARWLESRHGDRLARHAPAIAAHLEAEAAMGREAGRSGGDPGRRAAGLLSSVADELSALGDDEGALAALRRAAGLLDGDDPTRAEILLRTAAAFAASGQNSSANRTSIQAARAARAGEDGSLEARARLLRAMLTVRPHRRDKMETIWEAAGQAEAACREAEDDAGLSAVWSARAAVHRRWGHWAAAADDSERAAHHAARAGLAREESVALRMLVGALEGLPMPVEEAVERCRNALARSNGRRLVEIDASAVLGILLARRGSFEEAERRVEAALRAAEELDRPVEVARVLHRSARVEVLAGRPERAEEQLAQALDAAVRAGDRGVRAAIGTTLADVMLDADRDEEAARLLEEVERSAAADDVPTQVGWRTARARAFVRRGRIDEASVLARRAIRLAEQTDLMDVRARALLGLAEVLHAEGRPNEAAPFARRALRALERRGAVIPAERARTSLESLGHPATAAFPAPPVSTAEPKQAPSVPEEDIDAAIREPEGPADAGADAEDEVQRLPASPFADIAFREETVVAASRGDSESHPAPPERASGPWWSFGRH